MGYPFFELSLYSNRMVPNKGTRPSFWYKERIIPRHLDTVGRGPLAADGLAARQ